MNAEIIVVAIYLFAYSFPTTYGSSSYSVSREQTSFTLIAWTFLPRSRLAGG